MLIDTGCSSQWIARSHHPCPQALGARRLDRIINTHCHSDHMGGNAAIARAFQTPISVPLDAAAVIDRWDTRELLLDYADQKADRFAYASTIAAGDTLKIGGIEWRALAAPGHDMSALVFHARARALVSGDALWDKRIRSVEPVTGSPSASPRSARP